MDCFKDVYEKCEDCGYKCPIMQIIVSDTADGQTIYCPDCVRHHKYLEQKSKELAKKWGIDLIKYGKEVEKEERKKFLLSEKKDREEEMKKQKELKQKNKDK